MYIENKSAGLEGPARIGRVTFSKTGKSLMYDGKQFRSLKGRGFKANFFDTATGEEYWISGPKRNGADRLYGGGSVPIDADCRAEYWRTIRERPERVADTLT
ncbi:MAG: 1-deoxy-D-xylulose-5-phosphate synthase [Candidatus Elarobacter sp.]